MDNKQQKITNMVIDAKCILDYDLTIMKIFQFNYNHPDYVDQEVMHYSLAQLKNALVKRKDANPLTICIPETAMDRANIEQILEDIYKNNEYDIFKYITVTGTSKLIYMMQNHSSFDVTVVCKDENEKGLIEGRTKSFKTVIGYDSIDPKTSMDSCSRISEMSLLSPTSLRRRLSSSRTMNSISLVILTEHHFLMQSMQ